MPSERRPSVPENKRRTMSHSARISVVVYLYSPLLVPLVTPMAPVLRYNFWGAIALKSILDTKIRTGQTVRKWTLYTERV